MEPTGWLEPFLLLATTILAILTHNRWQFRDAVLVYSASVILLALSGSIINVILSIPLIVFSFYHIHLSLSQNPRPNLRAQTPTPV